jgi:hypothetical protein
MLCSGSTMSRRIGFLGPSGGDLDALERAATFLLRTEHVSRAIYLGNDGALDRCVVAWAKRLVGEDPSDAGAWDRAGELAAHGSPEEIDRFVTGERERLRLRALATLPEDAPYALESLGEVSTLMTFDAKDLGEEDLSRAHLVVVGNAERPSLEQRGNRWILELGPIGAHGGVAVLDAQGPTGVVTVYDTSEREILRVELDEPHTARLEIPPEVRK